MGSIKKKLMAGLLTLAVAASVFGAVTPVNAATPTAKQYLTKMEKASKKAKSYEMTQIMVNNYTYQEHTLKEKATYKIIKHMNPLLQKAVVTDVVNGDGVEKTQKMVSYLKEDLNGIITEYDSVDGGEYIETDVTDYINNLEKMSSNIYSNAKIEKKSVKVNKIDTVKISYQIKGEKLKVAFVQLGIDENQLVELGVDMNALMPVKGYVWLNKKTYFPVKEVIDMTDLVNSINAQMTTLGLQEELIHSSFKYSITYSNYNKAKSFELPEF